MEEDKAYELGVFCENFLTDPRFKHLTAEFEYATVHQILATKSDQSAERERIYSVIQGCQELFGFMATMMEAKRSMTPSDQKSFAEAESINDEPSDDEVFDIHRPLTAEEMDCTR